MARKRVRDEWLERIKAVEREYIVARKAVDDFIRALESKTSELPPNTKLRDVHTMSDNLEGTYLIRLFAAFESGLRSYWRTVKDTVPVAADLIDGVAARRTIPDDTRDDAHEVRRYRNSLVHDIDSESDPVAMDDARSRLCTFFARLPDNW
jgi:hypothetical protein